MGCHHSLFSRAASLKYPHVARSLITTWYMRKIPLRNSAWGLPWGRGETTQPHTELWWVKSKSCRWTTTSGPQMHAGLFTVTPHCKKWLLSLPSVLHALREITHITNDSTVLTAQAGVPSVRVSISEVHRCCHLLQSFHPVGLDNPQGTTLSKRLG